VTCQEIRRTRPCVTKLRGGIDGWFQVVACISAMDEKLYSYKAYNPSWGVHVGHAHIAIDCKRRKCGAVRHQCWPIRFLWKTVFEYRSTGKYSNTLNIHTLKSVAKHSHSIHLGAAKYSNRANPAPLKIQTPV
jgi:hypothetical protein